MKSQICHICNSEDFKLIRKIDDNISIARCTKCNTARTYQYPDFDFITEEKYSFKFYLDNEKMFRIFAKSMMDEIKKYRNRGCFLDIGCSVGYLLDEAKSAGFKEIHGIELNPGTANVARYKGYIVHVRPMEKLGFEKEVFDVIAFNHVLEHILDIKIFLSEVRRILKNDGIIYCGMPNYKSLMQLWLKSDWYGWSMPDHIWHFDAVTLRNTMKRNGFMAERIVQNEMYYPYSKSLRKNTRATIARIAGAIGLGDQIYGIFTKQDLVL